MNKEQLKELIAATLSIEEILDILGWESFELVEALEEEIMQYEQEFREACDI